MVEFDMRKHLEHNSSPVCKVCNHNTQAGTMINDVGGEKNEIYRKKHPESYQSVKLSKCRLSRHRRKVADNTHECPLTFEFQINFKYTKINIKYML